ncbi:hypothetical protein ABIB58_000555 [Brevundimonas sp. UYEF29]|uniref:hypothetical protein n=1 Tax=Brevundimonas sp. UYEF29 TaxID=3156346 RepID=UPI00339875A1
MGAELSHWLPDIDIAVGDDRGAFLSRMADLGRASGRFDIEHHRDAGGTAGFDVVNFRDLEASPHRELGFQLLTRPDTPDRVAVEVRAQRWTPDPPTNAVYCDAARHLVSPLLTMLNRSHSTRYRLRIERSASDRFKLSPRNKVLVDRFALLANTSSLHPLDWKRFYELVRESRQEIPEAELRALLGARGFSTARSVELAELYGHLWAFKRLR